jgi:glyoxylase-like metal-dependent hydrolase (beta-lactamase superfamily II)
MTIRHGILLLAALSWLGCGDADEEPAPAAGAGEAAAGEHGGAYAAEAPDSVHRQVRRIADGVYTYEYARPEDPVTTVSMFVVTDEGVLVADGQGNPEESALLLDEIARVTDQPVTHLVMASDHGDHTGGNAAFPESVETYGHPATRAALERTAAEEGEPVLLPEHLVSAREELILGGRRIEILFLGRGHTAGDLAVHLPEERILFMSEAFLDRVFPLMITAYPGDWVETLLTAEAMDADTYIAGHGVRGSIQYSKEDLVRYREAVQQVIAEVRRLHDSGLDVDQAVEQANFGALARQADYVYQAERAVRRVWAELEGELPAADAP